MQKRRLQGSRDGYKDFPSSHIGQRLDWNWQDAGQLVRSLVVAVQNPMDGHAFRALVHRMSRYEKFNPKRRLASPGKYSETELAELAKTVK